jgi:hypothetical protein
MKFLIKPLILILVASQFAACTTTRYKADTFGNNEVRMSGPSPKEEVVRRVEESEKEHYFLFGLISGKSKRNIAESVQLSEGEKLVNVQIKNEQSAVDGIVNLLGCLLTLCIVTPLIWQMRTTEIQGDVVRARP